MASRSYVVGVDFAKEGSSDRAALVVMRGGRAIKVVLLPKVGKGRRRRHGLRLSAARIEAVRRWLFRPEHQFDRGWKRMPDQRTAARRALVEIMKTR